MDVTRFPTEQTEHEKYYMQIEFYEHEHVDIVEEGANVIESFTEFLDEEGGDAVSEARDQLFNYEKRVAAVSHQIQIPYHGSVTESFRNNFNTQDMRDVFQKMNIGAAAMDADLGGVIEGIMASSQGTDRMGSMVQPFEALRGEAFNEQTQVYFDNPEFRTYNFEFTLIPRNVKDARKIMYIRDVFRYHASPGLTQSGMNWTYPSMIRFKFFRNEMIDNVSDMTSSELSGVGKGSDGIRENKNLFKSKMCYIESVDFAYGDEQYREFYDDESGQYYPALLRISLGIREVEHWTRDEDFPEPR